MVSAGGGERKEVARDNPFVCFHAQLSILNLTQRNSSAQVSLSNCGADLHSVLLRRDYSYLPVHRLLAPLNLLCSQTTCTCIRFPAS